MLIMAGIIIALYILMTATSSFWVNWWWFSSMHRRSLLTDRYLYQGVAFVAGLLIGGGIVGFNLILALRRTREPGGSRSAVSRVSNRILFWLIVAGTVVVGVITGVRAARAWETWALWINGSSFNQEDPYFHRDIGFYVFSLPALNSIYRTLLVLFLLAIAGTIVVYALRQSLRFNLDALRRAPETARSHVLTLLGIFAIVIGAGRWLAVFNSVYSDRGVVYGPAYVDMNVLRWANYLVAIISLVLAAALIISARRLQPRLLVGSFGVWVVVFIIGVVALPPIVQSAFVNPSELKRERDFISQNLDLTRQAYALDSVEQRESSGQEPLTAETLSDEQQTIDNIRLWDYRIARTTFQQLQSFVPYYSFDDVDVDQYVSDSEIVQVLTSAREMDQGGLPSTSQNWTNKRLVYTHGYGAVVAPVSQVSEQGLPVMVVSNIPPNGTGQFTITQPEIYFGDADSSWIILNSDYDEFSGIDSGDDVTRYQGKPTGGIELGNIFKRVMLGSFLGDRNVVLSGAVSGDSVLVLNRSVLDRVQKLTPFLQFDDDPYLVIADGKLYWIVDGYTTSNDYPGAQPSDGINYIRNSVKVVVDAYTGDVTYYRTNTVDPIADAYGKLFDGLFVPISQAPASIASHFRYPEQLFDIQSDIYSTAHVTDPTSYYNGEDRWTIASETIDGQTAQMEPYYVTMRLPGEDPTTYNLIRPFIPGGNTNRQNMTAWMSGRVTGDGQLQLVTYRFPRQETVFGPRQIEGRINQEPEISSQLSLWNQSGTQVIFGNMLVIPIDQSVLYVQPLYLQSTSVEGALPELQRVIVATNDKVVMRDTLAEAIEAVIEPSSAPVTELEPATTPETGTAPPGATPTVGTETSGETADLAAQAQQAFDDGQAALQTGDWDAYGDAQARLESLLQQIVSGAAATPPASATPVTP
jgi:uncharacterized membrane protein (UPF0182 family)